MNLLTQLNGADPLYLTMRVVQLLYQRKMAVPSDLCPFLELSALNAQARNDWMRAADYWSLASNLRQGNT